MTTFSAMADSHGQLVLSAEQVTANLATPLSVTVTPHCLVMSGGQSQLFNSSVTGGSPPYTYQWFWGTYPFNGPISGATNPTLNFTAPNGSGKYYIFSVFVTDSAGTHSTDGVMVWEPASDAPVYCSVEPVPAAPLTNVNASINGLETPPAPSPVGENFTVEIHLRNATATNVPGGVQGLEVQFYFGNILDYCKPIGFTDELGQTGSALIGPVLESEEAGFYPDKLLSFNPDRITKPPYTNATCYMVAAASLTGPWNGTDGLVAKIAFQITGQPSQSMGQPDFYAPLQIVYGDLANMVDGNINYIPPSVVQGTLLIRARVRASETIFIRADGSIDPPTAPISSVDNVTYTLTDNITADVPPNSSAITVERDNIIIDGAGYTVQGTNSTSNSQGMYIDGTGNVTIENININAFSSGMCLNSTFYNTISGNNITNNDIGLCLYSSSSNSISGNNITANYYAGISFESSSNYNSVSGNNIGNILYGIWFESSSNNSISGNNITANYNGGIWFQFSSSNTISGNNITNSRGDGINLEFSSNCNSISGNNITNNVEGIFLGDSSSNSISRNNVIASRWGGISLSSSSNNSISANNVTEDNHSVWLDSSSNNSISGNNIANNAFGIRLDSSSSNSIFHNSFVNNNPQVISTSGSLNVWDDGYPSGGNYWSDYNGTDVFSGAYQNRTGGDGIGDTPYVIDASNVDHYPFMNPWSPPDIAVTNLTSTKTVIVQGDLCNLAVVVANLGGYYETFNVTAYANMTAIGVRTVTVSVRNSTVILFTWNTTGFALGNYTVKAVADTVPGETNTANNVLTYYKIAVTIPGDLNGDFQVDLADLVLLAKAYGSRPGDPNWNSNADLACRGIIDLTDLVTLAMHYGQHYP